MLSLASSRADGDIRQIRPKCYSFLSELLRRRNVVKRFSVRMPAFGEDRMAQTSPGGDFLARITTHMAMPAPRIKTTNGVSHKA